MSVWGKLGGLGLGAVLGGPLGALVGAATGHLLFDRPDSPGAQMVSASYAAYGRWLESTGLFAQGGLFGPPPPDVVFATGLVALAAKMARVDGVVSHNEIAAFRRMIAVPAEDLPRVERLFDLARQTTHGYEAYARQLARHFADNRALLESVLDALFDIALADHALHEAELAFLADVAEIFGFSQAEFGVILASHVQGGGGDAADDPWRILGAERSMSDAELLQCYRRQIAEHHPDRLIAAGLPPEAVAVANDRAAVINDAWARIKAQRARLRPHTARA